MTVGIAGAGPVAQALGRHLRERGFAVQKVASRSFAHAAEAASFIQEVEPVPYEALACDRIIIAVADAAIPEVAGRIPRPTVALHTSGVYGVAPLEALRQAGVSCGAMHPLQTFPSPVEGYSVLPGATLAIDGDPEAGGWSREIAEALGSPVLRVPAESRGIYHAAAALAGNYLIAMLDAAIQTMMRIGVSESEARRALAGISRASLENSLANGTQAALTGPVSRGDAATVHRHQLALESEWPVRDLHRAGAYQALSIALRRGLPPEKADQIRNVLQNE